MMLLIEVEVDRRDLGGGVKNWEWIKKGVPLRVEIGPRDLEKNSVVVSRRDQPVKSERVDADGRIRCACSGNSCFDSGFAVCACGKTSATRTRT